MKTPQGDPIFMLGALAMVFLPDVAKMALSVADVLLGAGSRRAGPEPGLKPEIADSPLDAVPDHLVRQVRKQVAKVLHPDVGGDKEAMAAINAWASWRQQEAAGTAGGGGGGGGGGGR